MPPGARQQKGRAMKWIIREPERIGSAPWLAWTVAVLLAPSSVAELALAEAPAQGRRPCERSSAGHVDRGARLAAAGQGAGRLAARRQHGATATTQADAAGAVDGVKDGKYAFHTGQEPNPWWQVDLGQSTPLARLVVYNRLDYAPGLHNADTLLVLTSDDGQTWTKRYDSQGTHFGGIFGPKPFRGGVRTRRESRGPLSVRLQIPSPQPIFLHLDEVEVYGEADWRKISLCTSRPIRAASAFGPRRSSPPRQPPARSHCRPVKSCTARPTVSRRPEAGRAGHGSL